MRKDEKNCAHVRLDKKSTLKLRKIARITRRSLTAEANVAVDEYKPRLVYRDDGR